MNKVELIGNLCKDNDVRRFEGENANVVLRNTMAVSRKFKNKETGRYDADFINIQAWGHTAEFIEKFFQKGSKIAIVGRIETGSYTNKDGVKVYTTTVIVEDVEFASSKNDNAGGGNANAQGQDTAEWMQVPDELVDSLPFK